MSARGFFGTSSDSFLQILNDLNFNQNLQHHVFMKHLLLPWDTHIAFIVHAINNEKVLTYFAIYDVPYLVSVSFL